MSSNPKAPDTVRAPKFSVPLVKKTQPLAEWQKFIMTPRSVASSTVTGATPSSILMMTPRAGGNSNNTTSVTVPKSTITNTTRVKTTVGAKNRHLTGNCLILKKVTLTELR